MSGKFVSKVVDEKWDIKGRIEYVSKYIAFYCNFSTKNKPYKSACTDGIPDDEHMMFETCRRDQELN